MARGLNKVIMIGHAGKDAEMRYTPSGKNVANWSIAINNTYKSQGEEKTYTEWVNCEAWGALAEICNKYITKGKQVYVEGRLKTTKSEKDGVTRYFTVVVVTELMLLGSKGGNGNSGRDYEEDAGDLEDVGDSLPPEDDIPF